MTEGREKTMRMGGNIGAALGALLFLAFGIIDGYVWGRHGAEILLHHLMGGPVEPAIIEQFITVVAVVIGVFCTGAVAIVLGAVFGTLFGYIVDLLGGGPDSTKAKAHH